MYDTASAMSAVASLGSRSMARFKAAMADGSCSFCACVRPRSDQASALSPFFWTADSNSSTADGMSPETNQLARLCLASMAIYTKFVPCAKRSFPSCRGSVTSLRGFSSLNWYSLNGS